MKITEWPEIIAGMVSDGELVRILVCGGRDYGDKDKVFATLDRLVSTDENNQLGHPVTIIHGACGVDKSRPNWAKMKGADRLADDWAVCNWKTTERFPADWTRYSSAAGQVRNREMLRDGRPNLVVAFPGGNGTAHMIEISKEAGIPVIEIQ